MQRPRSKLQVSTFPFLAVLLCAMGALLLLLFIMDRRAKIAAQYTVAEAVAARKKRSKEEEDARQAAWERARALLHQSLLEQQNQLLGDAKGIEQGLSAADDKLAVVQTQHVDLEEKIKAETAQISVLQLRIASQDANLKNADKMETKSKAELMEAAKELAELEQAFRRLKALRERDKETYSVVPYRGKRGDLRPPIYVECVRDGVIFHPEKRVLRSWEFTPDSLRAEVERRTGPLALERTVKDAGRELAADRKVPYVLFLVRPDGIGSYYQAQGGLKGYQLDFGYELVDEYWVLDFNGDSNSKPLPTNFAKSGSTQTPSFRPASPKFGGGGAGPAGSGTGNPGSGGSGPGGWGSGAPGGNASSGPGGYAGGAPGGIGPGPGAIGPGPGGMTTPSGFGNGNMGTPGGPPYGVGNPSYRGLDTGIPTNGPAFVPFSRQQQPIAIASSGTGDPSLPFSGGPAPTPRSNLIAPLGGPSGAGVGPGYPAGGSPGNAPGPYGTSSGVPGEGGSLRSITMPIPGNNVGSGQAGSPTWQGQGGHPGGSPGQGGQPGGSPGAPGQGGQPGGSPGQGGQPGGSPGQGGQPGGSPGAPGQGGQPGGSPGQGGQPGGSPGAPGQGGQPGGSPSQGQDGQPGGSPSSSGQGGQPGGSPGLPGQGGQGQDQGGGDYMPGPPLPAFGPAPPRKPTPPPSPLSKLLGNKDFIITISCYAEHVTVSPSGLQYRWDQGNVAANEKGLVQTVTNLIARRQASVRAGEPPYRPIIRFQVPPDGYATYFRAYPLLEHLQVPMTKENTRD